MSDGHNNSPGRILYVSTKCGFFGGVERYIFDTAEALKRHGFSVSGLFQSPGREPEVFCSVFDQVYRPDDLDAIKYDDFDMAFVHKVDNARLICRIRNKFPTAVFVHDHDYYCLRRHKYFPFCRKNCSLPQSKIYCPVCSCFIERKPDGGLGLIDLREKFVIARQLQKCNEFIVMSDFMQDNLEMNQYRKNAISKLYPIRGLLPKAVPDTTVPPVILCCSQLIKGKGVDQFIKALRHVKSSCQAWIVGTGSAEPELKALAEKYRLTDKIEFKGWVSKPTELLDKATLAVSPARWQEPFGLTGIEAMAAGVPVVGFDVGGITEWLKNGVNGIAVKAGDTVAFAAAIDKLLANPEMAASYGQAGRKMINDLYSEHAFIEGFTHIMEKVKAE